MIPPVDVSDFEQLVAYATGSDDEIYHAIIGAFEAIEADVPDVEPLYEHVDPDRMNALFESTAGPMRICLRLWGYPVVITREDVRVYAPATTAPE